MKTLLGWNLLNDDRTNAELRARWQELAAEGDRSRTPQEGADILCRMADIHFELEMRRLHNVPDSWMHPSRERA